MALAEATAAAEHGKADFDQETGRVTAEASGQAPAMRGGVLGAPSRSASEQVRAEGGQHGGEQHGATRPAQRPGFAGQLLGFVGLIVAAVLLRGRSVSQDEHRAAA